MRDRRLTAINHAGLQSLLRVPEHATRAPLLCFLHGRDEAAPTGLVEGLTKFGPLSRGAPAAAIERFIIVAPQLPRAGDLWHEQAKAVQSLMLRLQAEHGSDPARCYLTGFSYGGNGVFDLALAHTGFWSALWPVDPTRWPTRDLAEPVWLSIGACARPHEKAFVDRLRSQTPDGAIAGARIHLDEGEDHVGCADRAYADTRIYDWLLAHARR